MAGRGSRMRPHTLVTPKPLLPIAGKPMVQRLVESLDQTMEGSFENIGFIIGDFGEEVEESLLKVAEATGAKGHIFHQDKPLGTAHAILCAEPLLEGEVMIAFSDTLFDADFTIDNTIDGVIYVKKVQDPSAFGVVQLDAKGAITAFVEKPEEFVSDMAIIGIYYLKDGNFLKNELQYLIDNEIRDKGEYQLTNALENMRSKGSEFRPEEVKEWLDCGNKDNTIFTNQRMLELLSEDNSNIGSDPKTMQDSKIIPPCYIGDNVELKNCVIGPHVSVGNGSVIDNAIVRNSIIREDSTISDCILENSMIGNHVIFKGAKRNLSLGDYSVQQ